MRAQTDVKSFEKALKGKPLYLRSNSADDVVTYTWDKNALKLGKVDVYALTAFLVKWAEAKNNHIILFGTSVDPIHFQYGGTKFSNIPFYFFIPLR